MTYSTDNYSYMIISYYNKIVMQTYGQMKNKILGIFIDLPMHFPCTDSMGSDWL